MEKAIGIAYREHSEVFAFLGNSLLQPMNQTPTVGLEPEFWNSFPDFSDSVIREAARDLSDFATNLRRSPVIDPVTDVAVEYTHLFVGPPSPAAAPWETMYRGDGSEVGFGRATAEMRKLLTDSGLELKNENHQYEDHMGIELLLLSSLCLGGLEIEEPEGDGISGSSAVNAYIEEHPRGWIDKFHGAVHDECPGGYYDRLLVLVSALLDNLGARLRSVR